MLTKLRAGALALAALLCAPAAAMAACPTAPTYTGLSGLDAASATKTMQSVVSAGSSQQLATPLIHGNDGSTTPKAVAVDGSCNMDVNLQTPVPAGTNLIGKVGIDQTTPGTTDSVTPKATESHLGEVGGRVGVIVASFPAPATTTAYADGNLIANNATAGSVTPLDFSTVCRLAQGSFHVWRAGVDFPDSGMAGKSLWLKLYRDSPTVTNGDHAAWLSTKSNYLGQIPITLDQHFSDGEDGVGAPSIGSAITAACASASQHAYGLLVSNGGSGTLQGSKTVTVTIYDSQN